MPRTGSRRSPVMGGGRGGAVGVEVGGLEAEVGEEESAAGGGG